MHLGCPVSGQVRSQGHVPQGHVGLRLRLPWVGATAGWAGLLAFLAVWAYSPATLWQVFAELRFSGLSWSLVRSLAVAGMLQALQFVPLGAFAVLAFGGRRRRAVRFVLASAGFGIAWLLTWLIVGLHPGGGWHFPGLIEMCLPTAGCLAGVILAGTFRLPPAAWLPSLAWRVVVLAVLFGVTLWLGLEALLSREPAPVATAELTTEERRALVEKFQRANPLRVPADQKRMLALSPQELRALLSWGVLLADPDARAEVRGTEEALAWRTSLSVPRRLGAHGYVSIGGVLGFESDGRRLVVSRCQLSIGSLNFRHWSCAALLRSIHRWVFAAKDHRALMASVTGLEVDARGLRVELARLELDPASRARLQQALGPGWEVRAAAYDQFDLLRRMGGQVATAEDRFAAILQLAFALAAARSEQGGAVQENQGAILALATVLGHPDVATLAGIERPPDWREIRAAIWPVRLRGRADWTRHFLVSAALTQLATATVSDAAGLLKEELDAAGGSGFSFGDMLANRAGTVFGEAAARDERAARGLQDWVVNHYETDGLMPPGDDLPEGISDAELVQRYGGVGGPLFTVFEAEIEVRVRRLATWTWRD
jgi:hypothetical protein